jgi:hypothetical protein
MVTCGPVDGQHGDLTAQTAVVGPRGQGVHGAAEVLGAQLGAPADRAVAGGGL